MIFLISEFLYLFPLPKNFPTLLPSPSFLFPANYYVSSISDASPKQAHITQYFPGLSAYHAVLGLLTAFSLSTRQKTMRPSYSSCTLLSTSTHSRCSIKGGLDINMWVAELQPIRKDTGLESQRLGSEHDMCRPRYVTRYGSSLFLTAK